MKQHRHLRLVRRTAVLPFDTAARRLQRMVYHGRLLAASDLRRLAAGELSAIAELVHAEAEALEAEAAVADARVDSWLGLRRHERRTSQAD